MPSSSFTRSSTMIAMSSAGLRCSLARLGGASSTRTESACSALLAVGDAELEARAGLRTTAPAGRADGVQEDVLAVIGGDEAEPLLLVVELDLAGGHRKPRSFLRARRNGTPVRSQSRVSRRTQGGGWRPPSSSSTARAADSPERTAPSMYPFQCGEHSLPAQWIGPIGSARSRPYDVQTPGAKWAP